MARTFTVSTSPDTGRFHFHDADGLWLPLNSDGYATPATALRALRRFYVVEATDTADTFTATRRTSLPLADVEAMHRTGVAGFEADRDREAREAAGAPAPVEAPTPVAAPALGKATTRTTPGARVALQPDRYLDSTHRIGTVIGLDSNPHRPFPLVVAFDGDPKGNRCVYPADLDLIGDAPAPVKAPAPVEPVQANAHAFQAVTVTDKCAEVVLETFLAGDDADSAYDAAEARCEAHRQRYNRPAFVNEVNAPGEGDDNAPAPAMVPQPVQPQQADAGEGTPAVPAHIEDAQCERCAGNGEIVTDWNRYLHGEPGDKGDEGTAACPDCDGTGYVPGCPSYEREINPEGHAAALDVEPARNMVEAMARAYEAARDGRAAEPIYSSPADMARDVRAALDAGWHLDAGAAALGDWPWWRSVESSDGGPLDVRAVRRDGGWRLYVESAAEALAEWPYVAEAAPPAAVRRLPDHGDHVHAYRVEAMMGRLPPAPGSHRAVMLALDAFEAAPWPRPLVEINPRPATVLDVLPPAPVRPFAPFLDLPAPAPRSMADVWQSLIMEFGPPLVMHRPALALEPEPRSPWDVLSVGEAFALYLAAACFGLALIASFL